MGSSKKGVIIALVIMAIGAAWLLNTLHVISAVDWVWTVCLAAAGLVTLAWGKLNKLSFLVGLFLVAGSVFSVLRQTGKMPVDVEVPVLVVVFGAIFLLAQLPFIPLPQMIIEIKEEAQKQDLAKKTAK